jgi:hypothetical protein
MTEEGVSYVSGAASNAGYVAGTSDTAKYLGYVAGTMGNAIVCHCLLPADYHV